MMKVGLCSVMMSKRIRMSKDISKDMRSKDMSKVQKKDQ